MKQAVPYFMMDSAPVLKLAANNVDTFVMISLREYKQTERILMSSARCCHSKTKQMPFAASASKPITYGLEQRNPREMIL